ncbi:MAG: hypothetical protein HQK51_01790 [Oligoflexia bacterium]|nr:hypothetical protein [Oligoflexia bacterium]
MIADQLAKWPIFKKFSTKILTISPYILCLLLAILQLYYICKYAVNVPFWDEWEFLNPDFLNTSLNWKWYFSTHNEHRIFFTKIYTHILYMINGWDIKQQTILNYFIFLLLVYILIRLARSTENKSLEFKMFPVYIVFFFSSLNFENHMWAFQNQIHFSLLFILLAIVFGFRFSNIHSANIFNTFLFSLCLLSAMFSFSAGLAMSFSLMVLFLVREWMIGRLISLRTSMVVLFMSLGFYFWFFYLTLPSTNGKSALSLVYPYTKMFWSYLMVLLAHGFGFDDSNYRHVGILIFLLWVLAATIFISNRKHWRNDLFFRWFSLSVVIMSALVSISLGRAQMGFASAYASRYTEFTIILIPSIAMMYWQILSDAKYMHMRRIFLSIYFVVLLLSYSNNFSDKIYLENFKIKQSGIQCLHDTGKKLFSKNNNSEIKNTFVNDHVFGNNHALGSTYSCIDIYPMALNEKLLLAYKFRVSFTRSIDSFY